MAIRLMPSAESLVIKYLKEHASITPLVGTRVATALPPTPTFPFLTLTLAAGVEKDAGYLDEYYLDLNAWGTTSIDAELLIRTARAVMIDAHLATHTRGVVSNPRTILLPLWQPDTDVNPPRARYVSTLAITVHPHPL